MNANKSATATSPLLAKLSSRDFHGKEETVVENVTKRVRLFTVIGFD